MGYDKMGFFILIMVSMVLVLNSPAYAATGPAVYYKPPYVPSACYGNQDNGVMVAGVSSKLWNNRGACGRSYRVRCIRGANKAKDPCKQGSVVVKVVDYCRDVCNGDINLSRDAFSQIANLDAGKVIVQYDLV